ncbi:MAG: peptidylprolyl isomerase [Myxococcaceae bacterium]
MKKALIAAVAVAGLGFAGCKSRSEEVNDQRADLAREAQKANKEIADIRSEAAKDKAEVDARAAKEIADERKDVADERGDLAKVESDLSKEQRKDAVNALPAGTMTGTLQSTLGNKLTLRDNQGVEHSFGVKDSTRVTFNGQNVELDDYREGTEVRASFVSEGNDKIANDVVILAPASKLDARDHRKLDSKM